MRNSGNHVSNWVHEIQDLTNPQNWRFVKGEQNPADIVSRGCSAEELMKNSRFWHGPHWLTLSEENWPKNERLSQETTNEERRVKYISINYSSEFQNEEPILDINDFSSISKIFRITAWIRRFINNLKLKKEDRIKTPLSAEEIEEAEEIWIKKVQAEKFAKNRLTELLVKDAHEKVLHSGVADTLIQVREKYWIPKGRQISLSLGALFAQNSIPVQDNARTFTRAEIELRRLWTIINHLDVKEFCASKGVKWKYIIERGAWWGGFYERIVRSVKTILRKVIGKSSLTSEELETVLCEIEAVLNSHPITYIDSDSTGNFPLTPSHFLLGRRLTSLPAVKLSSIDCVVDKKVLIKRFNYRERLLNNFWRQWRKDYLLNLKSVHFVNPTRESEFKINDIVLIHDDR
ncbi:integrase catalytic domain-containing protein [Trichonephila clavata]|uniref:Integrase catalytic domain-containing protein n=1 Tax=Trichonephila clavata TaxID=2740835 RepID=A0A8X6FIX8_TRICU|nr:integrase catalytic domain-containing protein [Trichonephila clavata]